MVDAPAPAGSTAAAKEKASALELVRYADARDWCLMALGALGSFGDGMMQPLSMLVLGDIVNSYGGAGTADSAFSSSAVDKASSRNTNVYYTGMSHCPHGQPSEPSLPRCCSSRFGCCTSRLPWAPALS
jgi:hypothetical protein